MTSNRKDRRQRGEAMLSAARQARLAQAETVLRGHPDWSDDMVASWCKLSEAEVAGVRATVLGATA